MSPKIAVCIPTFNRAHFLQEAIKSVLEQTVTDFEIYISDNDSSDNTAEIVADFDDVRIHYHRQSQNIGLLANTQAVIDLALTKSKAEFIAVLSDDDLYLPDHFSTALEALNRNPDVAYYVCSATRFGNDANGELRPIAITDTETPLIYFAPKDSVKFLGIDNPGPMMTMLCRKDALTQEIFWGKPDYIPADLLVMTQLMIQGGFLFGNRSTALYRHHGQNASNNTDSLRMLKLNCMVWYGVRYLAQFLINKGVCTLNDIETHGKQAVSENHVVPLVIGLSSFDSPPAFRAVAKRIFDSRIDMDSKSARFRLARRIGFSAIPISEKVSQIRSGWRP